MRFDGIIWHCDTTCGRHERRAETTACSVASRDGQAMRQPVHISTLDFRE